MNRCTPEIIEEEEVEMFAKWRGSRYGVGVLFSVILLLSTLVFQLNPVLGACPGETLPDAYLAAIAIEAKATWITADDGFARFTPDLRWTLLRP